MQQKEIGRDAGAESVSAGHDDDEMMMMMMMTTLETNEEMIPLTGQVIQTEQWKSQSLLLLSRLPRSNQPPPAVFPLSLDDDH
jgi:hypothetical protein